MDFKAHSFFWSSTQFEPHLTLCVTFRTFCLFLLSHLYLSSSSMFSLVVPPCDIFFSSSLLLLWPYVGDRSVWIPCILLLSILVLLHSLYVEISFGVNLIYLFVFRFGSLSWSHAYYCFLLRFSVFLYSALSFSSLLVPYIFFLSILIVFFTLHSGASRILIVPLGAALIRCVLVGFSSPFSTLHSWTG